MGFVIENQRECTCPVRDTCPLCVICGSREGSGSEGGGRGVSGPSEEFRKNMLPRTVSKVEKGKLLWTNLHFEQCVHVIQGGLFTSFGYNEQGQEIPFALFGAGIVVGIAELYLPSEISDTYHVRSLLPGTVCTVPLRSIRQRLRSVSRAYEQRLLISALTNQASSAFTQAKVVSRNTIYERVLALLLYIHDLTARGDTRRSSLSLTHEEVATLVLSDRVSVTRALHKMRNDGLIELGYKSITLCESALDEHSALRIAPTQYLIADQEYASEGSLGGGVRMDEDGLQPPYLFA